MRVKLHLDMLLTSHRRQQGLRLLGFVDRIRRTVLCIVSLLLALETCFVFNRVQVLWVTIQFRVQLLLRNFLFLAKG